MSKEKRSAVINSNVNPLRKKISASFSILPLFLILPRMDKKESMQLDMKNNMATVVSSSIIVLPEMLSTLSEVSTTKQSPNKLEEALRICGDLSLFSAAMFFYLKIKRNKNRLFSIQHSLKVH
jgi:hypothetical protein